MPQTMMHLLKRQERTYSAPDPRLVVRRKVDVAAQRRQHFLRNGLPTPPSSPPSDYDSDSEYSDSRSEPGSRANDYNFKDSGYNSWNSSPAPSSPCNILNRVPSQKGQSPADHSTCESESTSPISQPSVQEETLTALQLFTPPHTESGKKQSSLYSCRSVLVQEADILDESEDVRPDAAAASSGQPHPTEATEISQPQKALSETNRKAGSTARLKLRHRSLAFWRLRANSSKDAANARKTVCMGSAEIETQTGASQERTDAFLVRGQFEAESPRQSHSDVPSAGPHNLCATANDGDERLSSDSLSPVNTEPSMSTSMERDTHDRSSPPPSVPPELPLAIASLQIDHTDSQPSSALGRTPDSSRTLNSLSEGELSFMGVDCSVSTHLGLTESFDAETARCLKELADRIVQRCIRRSACDRLRTHGGPPGSCSSSSWSNSSTTQSSPRETPVTSATSTPLRAHFQRKGEDDEDGAKRSRTPKRKQADADPAVKLFACPYAKFDPSKYSRENLAEPNYWNCGSCCLRDISRLKQHLYRVHSRPSYYCGSCYASFKNREDLDQHTRHRPPCEISAPRYTDRMTDNQFHAIKRRIIRGDAYELWFNIFRILFPNAPRPPSPYISTADAATINHFVTLFRWFGPEELMNLMNDRRRRGRHPLELSTQAVVDEAFEIAMPNLLERSRYSQASHTLGTRDTEVPEEFQDEEPLTMAPLSVVPPHIGTLLQPIEAEDDNTPRTMQLTSGGATGVDSVAQLPPSHPLPPFVESLPGQSHMTGSDGWASTDFNLSQVNVAFNTYAQFTNAFLQPSQWADHNLEGPNTGFQDGIASANFDDYCT